MIQKTTWALSLLLLCSTVMAEDWPRFRGPLGNGVSTSPVPTAWSPKANIAWKAEMPGPGASSPIVIGNKAFLTCYSGYGLTKENPGKLEDLVRHLVCVDVTTGKKLWQQDVPVQLPEDPYTGIGVTAHGYASHTPVSDGKHVYAFFGKSGVHAFDMEGKKLWDAQVGKESDPTKWGSSSSPIVYKNMVIVTASAESQSIIALDKDSGEEIWRQEAEMLDGMWGTPALVKVDDERMDLVMVVAKELWGLDPETGKMRWYADATGAQHAYTSVIQDGKRVYAFTGRGGGSLAVDVGGEGNITESNTVWTGQDTASFATPVRHKDKVYLVAQNIVTTVDAKTGERLGRLRLKNAMRMGGQFGSLDYPSPLVIGDHLYYMNGSGQMYVFKLGDELEQVSVNRVTSEKETFWGTPAVSDGKLLIRSSKALYCVADKGDKVNPDDNKPTGPTAEQAPPRRRFDPMEMFAQMDSNKDDKLVESELANNRMKDRLMTLDKDKDNAISKAEFESGIRTLFTRGGRGGGRRGGGRSGGGGRRGYDQQDSRPDRPKRPKMADK